MKPFTKIVAVFLLFGALMHLLRFFYQWEVTVGPVSVPMWGSPPAVLVAAFFGVMLWREAHR